MPRQAHGRSLLKAQSSRPTKRKSQRKAALNALETAERQIPDSVQIRQHRLGEVEDDSDVQESRADTDGRSSKRRKVTNEREAEDEVEEGSDLEGGTWHIGIGDEDEDSDLDSDEAFGESDEEKFADFTFRGSGGARPQAKSKKVRIARDVDLDEEEPSNEDLDDDDDDDEDDLGDEAIDLAAAWDMSDDQETVGTKSKPKSKSKRHDRGMDISDSSSSNPSDDDDSGDAGTSDTASQFSISEDEINGDNAGLRTFVESLSSSNKKMETQKRRQATDAGLLPHLPSRTGLPPSKLSAADLLQYVKDPVQRQSLKILANTENSAPSENRRGIPGKLSAPLAKRQQDKLDRGAAYEQSKATLNRWIDTVKQNRRAEHLSFPLVDHTQESALGQKQLMPTTQSAPANELENTINNIMQESGMSGAKGQSTEDHEQAFEELAEKKMDIEAVKARRAELRMARELMFREEIRARRIKKIKSKAFRRVHRKEKDRIEAQQREAIAAAGLLNSDEEREKRDRRRAEERMGARHRESKWAKSIKQTGRAAWDEDARAGVIDIAKRDEELRRRILGKDAVEGSDLESSSESDIDSETEAQLFDEQLATLEGDGNKHSKSKLGQMAFMQRAEAARKAENDEEIRQLRLALDDKNNDVVRIENNYQVPPGRQKFGVSAPVKAAVKQRKSANEFEAPVSSEDDNEIANVVNAAPIENDGSTTKLLTKSATQRTVASQTKPLNGRKILPRPQSTGQNLLFERRDTSEQNTDDYTSSSGSEDDAQNNYQPENTKDALAASIFAGPDDFVQEFAREKAELVEEEGDQIIDDSLPGWGSWTGVGVSKREQKKNKNRFITTVKGIAPEKRQDAKLDRVIVNEKLIKKNGKYLATELPHPFENRQQYERSLRLPIGPEWSTANHYQDSIKPRLLLKQGTAITPIAKPSA